MRAGKLITVFILIVPGVVLAQSPGWFPTLFSSPPTIVTSALIVLLLLFIFFINLYRQDQQLEDMTGEADLSTFHPRWIRKRAVRLARTGLYRPAGELYTYLGEHVQAAEMYRKGKHRRRAVESYLKAGMIREAARVQAEFGAYEEAAQLYLEAGDFLGAAKSYEKAGDQFRAAQMFEKAGLYQEAAEAYLDQNLFRRAAEMYELLGQPARAADMLQRDYEDMLSRQPEDISEQDNYTLRLLSRRIGELYLQEGRLQEAAEAFRRGAWLEQSAKAREQAQDYERAAETYLEAKLLADAARCLEKLGRRERAAGIKAQALIEEGKTAEAIPYLEQAGEYEQVAHLYMSLDNTAAAGEFFEKAGKHLEAAEMFVLLKDYARAATNLERAGDFVRAAEFFAKAGEPYRQALALEKAEDYYQAGQIYLKQGIEDQAIETLQKLEKNHPDFERGLRLLAEIFRNKGLNNLAREYYRRLVENQELTRANLDDYYELARTEEQMGEVEQAMSIYEKILLRDYHYKDVSERVGHIKSSRTIVDTPTEAQEETQLRGPGPGFRPIVVRENVRYQLFEVIGRGGMGIVYRARDTVLEREVAYKVLPANLKDHPQALKNFFREAKSAARLNHPNIVMVFDAGEEGGNYYIAMELLRGRTIKEILNEEVRLPLNAVLMVSGQICRALEYAHSQKVVHRDIKSSNIMWTTEKQVKIMDFGLAKVIEEVKGYQTIASGTPYYMSPEQTLGKDIDHRTDIYSLGVTMFEMITGQLPFRHGDAAYHHVHTPPPQAKDVYEGTPAPLSEIILKCMQKNPADRFQSAAELFEALKAVKEER